MTKSPERARLPQLREAVDHLVVLAQSPPFRWALPPRFTMEQWNDINTWAGELYAAIESAQGLAIGISEHLAFGVEHPGRFETRLRLALDDLERGIMELAEALEDSEGALMPPQRWRLEKLDRFAQVLKAVAVPPDEATTASTVSHVSAEQTDQRSEEHSQPSGDARLALTAIERWKQTAADEVENIGGWRDADPGDRQHLFWSDPARSIETEHGSTMPRGFYADTAYLLGWVASIHEKLDPTPLQDVYDAVAAWHHDHNGDRLPEQSHLLRKLDRAMQVVDAVEIHLRRSTKRSVTDISEWDADRSRLKHLVEAMSRSIDNAGSWSQIGGVFERQEEAERLALKLGFAGSPLKTRLYDQDDPSFARHVGRNPDGLTSVMTFLSFRPLGGLTAGNLGGYRPGTVNGEDGLFEIEFPFQPWKERTIACLEEWVREIDGMRADGALPLRYPRSAVLMKALGDVTRSCAFYGSALSMLTEVVEGPPTKPESSTPPYAPPEQCLPPEPAELVEMRAKWESHQEKLDSVTREHFRRLDMFYVARLEADEAASRCEDAADAAADELRDEGQPASKQVSTRVRSLLADLRERVKPWFKLGKLMSPEAPVGIPKDPSAESTAVQELGRRLQALVVEVQPIAEQRRAGATLATTPDKEAGKVAAVESARDRTPVHKPDGWTKADLLAQANKDGPILSGTKFDTIRERAKVAGAPRGGAGPHYKYSRANLKKLIAEVQRGSYQKSAAIAAAWGELLMPSSHP